MTEPTAASYRDRASKELGLAGNHYDAIQQFLDGYEAAIAHDLAEKIRAAAFTEDGPGTTWNWWDAATIPDSCADLIDPQASAQPEGSAR